MFEDGIDDIDMDDNTNLLIDLTQKNSIESKKGNIGKLINFNASNILVPLRKICNHPYLVLESCLSIPDDLYDQYLVTSSGKLAMLSIVLDHLIKEGHKVLIFSQMTTMLDIIQGFLHQKGYLCYRLDGNTDRFTRDKIIKEFHQTDPIENQIDDNEEIENNDLDENNDGDNTDNSKLKSQSIESASIFLLSTRAGLKYLFYFVLYCFVL